MIQFKAKHLKSVLPFKGIGDIRYYLNSIHIEPHPAGGAVLVATNGHMMMVIRDVSARCSDPATFKISAAAGKFCGSKRDDRESLVTINPITERLIITSGATGEELFVEPGKCMMVFMGDHQFPDWKRVIPKFSSLKLAVADTLSAEYLAKAANAHPLGRRIGSSATAIRLWQAELRGVVAVEFDGTPDHMLLIMPIRERHTPRQALDSWSEAFGSCLPQISLKARVPHFPPELQDSEGGSCD